MKKKILFTASTYSHINNFHLPYIKFLKGRGDIVHVMAGGKPQDIPYADRVIEIPFEKKITSPKNFMLAIKMAKILRKEKYDIISTHTSLAAFFTRLAVMFSMQKTFVINTVHGYLFDEKTNTLKKSIMLMAEIITRGVTDVIVTMNRQDNEIARKYKLYKKAVYNINGMGVDYSNIPDREMQEKYRKEIRAKYNIRKNDFVMSYAAEFSDRKNQKMLIDAMQNLSEDAVLILMGDGANYQKCKELSKEIGVENRVMFTGFTKEVYKYYSASDCSVSASRIEGLPFNIMEALAIGLPVITSNVKGHEDLISNGYNGYLYDYDDVSGFCDFINKIKDDEGLKFEMSKNSILESQKYSMENVFPEIVRLYE
ncbi:MAG: glycosyltransferase [Proteocatella sp.]